MAAGNPLVAQGSLNRLKASIVIPGFPELNITPSYLGREGIGLSLEGDATGIIPSMAGIVTSPEPYMIVTLSAHLLKSQSLASAYKAQMEDTTLLGDITCYTDSVTFGPYQLNNMSIQAVAPLNFSGADAGFGLMLKGYYLINASLWD